MSEGRARMKENGQRASLVASLVTPPDARALAKLPAGVDWLEARADRVGDLDPASLRKHGSFRLLYTLRSWDEGGADESTAAERHRRILAALDAGYDAVDLEGDRDLDEALLTEIPPEKRWISWHGPSLDPGALREVFDRISQVPAALYKLVPAADSPGQAVVPLLLLRSLGRRDVTAFATGMAGLWSRLLAPRLGAPLVYGSTEAVPAAPGQPSVQRLCRDFGLPELPPVERLFGIVGNPVSGSLSPRLHNAAYRRLGLPYLYLPFEAASFGDLWLDLVESERFESLGWELAGLSVTAPFKDVALAAAGAASPRAQRIGAANTLVRRRGVWEATSTDPEGILLPLAALGVEPAGRRAVVVGAGGAGRSAAVGLVDAGAMVTLANRGRSRGEAAAGSLGLPFLLLEDLEPGSFDIVVNASPAGRSDGDLPFDVDGLRRESVLIDMVYGEEPTALVRRARARGIRVVDGLEVLFGQAVEQFRRMTAEELPRSSSRGVLGLPESSDLPEKEEDGGRG